MKRGILLILLASIAFAAMASAQQDELTVRFRSVGKNATIDLRSYLGESAYYVVSKTTHVKVTIDQEKGLAYIEAVKGWEGTESIFFTTIESQARQPDIPEYRPPTPPPPLVPEERPEEVVVRYEEPLQILRDTLDISLIDLVEDIRKERIRTISKKVSKDAVSININDEVNINIQKGYKPKITMDFSLGGNKTEEAEVIPGKKGLMLKINNTQLIIIFAVILAISIYFYSKHARKKEVETEEKGSYYAISQDVKQLSLDKLHRFQKEIGKKGSSEEFIKIFREFFSKYFGVEYDFDLKQLIRTVKGSDIKRSTKNEIISFLKDVSKFVFYPTEEWTEVYGTEKVPKKDLNMLVIKMKQIIRKL